MSAAPPQTAAAWAGTRVGVYGLGLSGAAAARLLVARGATVRLLDDRPPAPERLGALGLADLAGLEAAGVVHSPADPDALVDLDALVVSPGVPPTAAGRTAAARRGLPTLGELELAAQGLAERLVLVTGSHGKSTVTTWTAALLEAAGTTAVACGNLGRPLAELVLAGDLPQVLVVEASSFQLHDSPGLRVAAAVFTAYAPNHLDWHPDEDHYRHSKLALVEQVLPDGRVSYLPGFPGLAARLAARPDLTAIEVGPEGAYGFDEAAPGQVRTPAGTLALGELPEGPRLAALAPSVALAAAAAAATPAALAAAASRVAPLPHRLEDLGRHAGIRYVNDSKATTPTAAAYALGRIPPPAVLILGGKDKGLRFDEHAGAFAGATHLVFTGAARPRLERELGHLPHSGADEFDEALRLATQRCPAGGTVLLAPGCSSFDRFASFEARGQRFRDYVQALEPGVAA